MWLASVGLGKQTFRMLSTLPFGADLEVTLSKS